MRAFRKSIPNFSLYGDADVTEQIAQSTHIEDIPSRSKKYLWQIDTHRHLDLVQCVVVRSGPATVTLEGRQFRLTGPAAIFVPAGAVHSFRFDVDTAGYVLTVHLLPLLAHLGVGLRAPIERLFAYPHIVDLHKGDPVLSERVLSLLECLLQEYRRPVRLPDDVAASLAAAALTTLATNSHTRKDAMSVSDNDADVLRAFRRLIEDCYTEHWPIAHYARALKRSETTLNRLCFRMTGTTAFNLIQQRVALEAQRRLIYAGTAVSGIATELGFKDLAYFSRFFRRHCGSSPSHFRRRNGGGKVPMTGDIVQ